MLDRREVYTEAEITKEIDDEPHDFASYIQGNPDARI